MPWQYSFTPNTGTPSSLTANPMIPHVVLVELLKSTVKQAKRYTTVQHIPRALASIPSDCDAITVGDDDRPKDLERKFLQAVLLQRVMGTDTVDAVTCLARAPQL